MGKIRGEKRSPSKREESQQWMSRGKGRGTCVLPGEIRMNCQEEKGGVNEL